MNTRRIIDFMSKFVSITRPGQENNRELQKIYFCCHPDDFGQFFHTISEDILERVDAAIWYDEDPKAAFEVEAELLKLPLHTTRSASKSQLAEPVAVMPVFISFFRNCFIPETRIATQMIALIPSNAAANAPLDFIGFPPCIICIAPDFNLYIINPLLHFVEFKGLQAFFSFFMTRTTATMITMVTGRITRAAEFSNLYPRTPANT